MTNFLGALVPRSDTAANWAASALVLQAGERGYDTTNDLSKVGNGVDVWSALTAVGSGTSDVAVLGEVIVGVGGVASIAFTSIPQTHRHLSIEAAVRSSAATVATNMVAQFNADTAANYVWQRLSGSGATTGAAVSGGDTSIRFAEVPGTSVAAGEFAYATAKILAYSATLQTGLTSRSFNRFGPGGSMGVIIHGGRWGNTAPVTSIQLSLLAGNFIEGSIVTLYGMKGAA